MFRHLRSNSLVGNTLQKYDDWQIEILHTTKDRNTANLLEIEEIRHYNCVAPNGYNLTRGGDGVNYWEGRKNLKHSKFMRGNQNALGNKSTKGQHWNWSDESKNKAKGRKRPDVAERNKGNQYAKGAKNASYRTEVKIKRLKTRLKKLEVND